MGRSRLAGVLFSNTSCYLVSRQKALKNSMPFWELEGFRSLARELSKPENHPWNLTSYVVSIVPNPAI